MSAAALNLTQVYTMPGTGWSSRDIEWDDFNGDGLKDLLVASNNFYASNPSLMVLKNLGGDQFSQAWASPYPGENQAAATAGDIDGDGDLDILTTPYSGNPFRLYRNDGNFSFTLIYTGPAAYYLDAKFADFDGDGDLDFAVSDLTYGGVRVYRNGGGGSFTLAASLYTSGNQQAVAVGDMDNDGKIDLIAGVTGYGSQIWRNNGGFSFSSVYTLPWSNVDDAAWADMDGDGDLDVVVATANGSPGPAKLYRNNGDMTFTLAWQGIEANEDRGSGVALGDLDGDGLPEIVLASYVFNTWLHVYHNDGGLSLSKAFDWASTGSPQMPSLADYDGDGDLDIALAQDGYSSASSVFVWRNDRIYWSPTPTPTRTPSPSASVTPTASPSRTVTLTPTETPSFSVSPTISPSFSESQTFTISPTFTDSPVATATLSFSPSRTPSPTQTFTQTPVAALCGLQAFSTPGATVTLRGMAVGAAGSLVVGSHYSSPVTNYFLAGLDGGGAGLWGRSEAQAGSATWGDDAYGAAADPTGYVVAGTGDDTGFPSASMRISRYDLSGTLQWYRMWRDTQHSYGLAAASRAGQSALIGRSTGPSGYSDIRVLAYDSAGSLLWTKAWRPASGWAEGFAGAYSACGELWVGGYYDDWTSDEGLLYRYDAAGNLMQTLVYSGANNQQVRALAADRNGGVVVGLQDNGNVRLLRLDAAGAAQQDISTGMSEVRGVAQDREGGLLAGGKCGVYPCVRRYRADNSLHWAWQSTQTGDVASIGLQADDSVLVAANLSSGPVAQRLCPPALVDAGLTAACLAATPTPTATPSVTASPTASPTRTITTTRTPTPTASQTRTPTGTRTLSPTPTTSPGGNSCGSAGFGSPLNPVGLYGAASDQAGGAWIAAAGSAGGGFSGSFLIHVSGNAGVIQSVPLHRSGSFPLFAGLKEVAVSNGIVYGVGVAPDLLSGTAWTVDAVTAGGAYLWTRQWRDLSYASPTAAVADASGVVVAGFSVDQALGHASLRLASYDAAGNTRWTASWEPSPSLQSRAWGIAQDACGQLWVAGDAQNGSDWDGVLLRYNDAGVLEQRWTYGGAGDQSLVAVKTDPLGQVHLLLNDNGASKLLRLSNSGTTLQALSTGYSNAVGLALDAEGASIVLGKASNVSAKRYRQDGSLDWTWTSASSGLPYALTVLSSGTILALSQTAIFSTLDLVCQAPLTPLAASLACPSPTPTASFTVSPTASPSASASPSWTASPTATATASASPTLTASATPTGTGTMTETATVTVTETPSASATLSLTATESASATLTATETATETLSPTDSATASATASSSGTPSGTPSLSATSSVTATLTATPNPTDSATATLTASATQTPPPTASPSATASPTASPSPSATPTRTPFFIPLASPTPSPSPTGTGSVSATPGLPSTGAAPFRLRAAYPQPFADAQTLWLQARVAGRVRIRAYDVAGEKVFEDQAFMPAGDLPYVWQGANADGGRLASGTYLVLLHFEGVDGEEERVQLFSAIAR